MKFEASSGAGLLNPIHGFIETLLDSLSSNWEDCAIKKPIQDLTGLWLSLTNHHSLSSCIARTCPKASALRIVRCVRISHTPLAPDDAVDLVRWIFAALWFTTTKRPRLPPRHTRHAAPGVWDTKNHGNLGHLPLKRRSPTTICSPGQGRLSYLIGTSSSKRSAWRGWLLVCTIVPSLHPREPVAGTSEPNLHFGVPC